MKNSTNKTKSMKTKVTAIALFTLTAAVVVAYPSLQQMRTDPPIIVNPVVDPAIQQQKRIEVVFVLDTTGSMSGLISAAKEKIWSIASWQRMVSACTV